MNQNICIVLFIIFCILTSSAAVSLLSPPRGCYYNGKFYRIGAEFKPWDCEFCRCTENGTVACAIMDCARPPCPNPVKIIGKCCPVCPTEYLPVDKDPTA